MSGQLKISFAPDMPPASVEVVAPDNSTVDRVYLAAGQNKMVEVPSEGSFLRVHLQSGQVVTLKDPGNLNRTISVSDIVSKRRREPSYSALQKWAINSAADTGVFSVAPPVSKDGGVLLSGGLSVRLQLDRAPGTMPRQTGSSAVIYEVPEAFMGPGSRGRTQLLLSSDTYNISVSLPESLQQVEIRSSEVADRGRLATVRVKTYNPHADTISGYLHRGDLYSAQSGIDWAETAEQLLMDKISDPYAATVGAFLLLRLRRIDLLHDWTSNLMNWFPDLSDAVIIRAWHLIYLRRDEGEIRSLFEKALEGALPVFTEGLRLLSDGARLLDKDSYDAVEKLNRLVRRSLSSSPFTTTVLSETEQDRWEFDIDYAASM